MFKKLLLTYVFLLLVVMPCWAESSDLTMLLTDLKLTAADTNSLTSSFEQEKHLAIFAEKLISHGRFIYQNPDQLRWELLTPVASGFVLKGAQGERWNQLSGGKGNFSVDKDPIMGMIAQQLLAWAKVDLDWLKTRYQMELVTEQPVVMKLTPLDEGEAGFIDHLQISFADDRRYVAQVLMVEQGGDSTLLRFNDVEINLELPQDAFTSPEFQ
jgi:Outer membrane lipoprotein carrier protein LolA